MRETIFIVDDSDVSLTTAKEALKRHYRVMTLPSAEKMFALIKKITPDLILLDIEMPDMDGFEVLHHLKHNVSLDGIPVILLTGRSDIDAEIRGLQLGVVDFITKPFSEPVLLNRIRNHLNINEIILERTARLQRLQNGIVFVLADVLERRDLRTGGHVERTTAYVRILLESMREQGVYADEVDHIDTELFVSSARLHDVGKISISDVILNKPGKLTEEEFAIMKTHPTEGERIIDQIVFRTGGDETFLHYAKSFAGYHHERWNGRGYPYGLKGTNIPLEGRIMAFADVYDAMVSIRSYKESLSHEEAIKTILENADDHFDPIITTAFYDVCEKFKTVKLEQY